VRGLRHDRLLRRRPHRAPHARDGARGRPERARHAGTLCALQGGAAARHACPVRRCLGAGDAHRVSLLPCGGSNRVRTAASSLLSLCRGHCACAGRIGTGSAPRGRSHQRMNGRPGAAAVRPDVFLGPSMALLCSLTPGSLPGDHPLSARGPAPPQGRFCYGKSLYSHLFQRRDHVVDLGRSALLVIPREDRTRLSLVPSPGPALPALARPGRSTRPRILSVRRNKTAVGACAGSVRVCGGFGGGRAGCPYIGSLAADGCGARCCALQTAPPWEKRPSIRVLSASVCRAVRPQGGHWPFGRQRGVGV
jgi:hypothetical protein